MAFKREELKPKYIGVIDFWTYKIRVGICKMLNKSVELIWYWEKRQDINDLDLWEPKNLESTAENIANAIQKAEIDAKMKVDEFVINTISPLLFFESSRINFIRNLDEEIAEEELYEIFKNIESQAFRNNYRKIKSLTGYGKSDLKLIINNISNIQLDNEFYGKNLLWTNPKEINVAILNIFITISKYELKNSIAKYLNKNISSIIPIEFALLSLFNDKKSIVIIDLWNSHISIILKKDRYILWAKKLSFWMNDLIKRIRANYKLTKIEIIRRIDEDIFVPEKVEFLEILKDIIAITLEDILRWEVCPNEFFMAWWWANKFIRDYLSNTDFNSYNLKLVKNISFVSPKIDFIDDKITENPNWIDEAKSNINIYAMIRTSLDFVKKEKDKLERTIKKIVEEIN